MGRRENAVAAKTEECGRLALWLRAQRRPPLTYAAMETWLHEHHKHLDLTFYTASALSRAASGHAVPVWPLVEAYTKACDGDIIEARHIWQEARQAEPRRRELAALVGEVVAHRLVQHPELIDNFAELRRAMVVLRAQGGRLSFAELQDRAGRTEQGRHRLPRSSLSAVLRGDALPRRSHVTAFAQALGVTRRRVEEWGRAWDRATRVGDPPPAALPRPPYRSPDWLDAFWPAAQLHISLQPADTNPDRPPFLVPGGPSAGRRVDYVHIPVGVHGWGGRSRPGNARGPRRPHPPAGRTGAGLPIRVPRRYTTTTAGPPARRTTAHLR